MLARRNRNGDCPEVIYLEYPPGLIVVSGRFISPAKVARALIWIEPQITAPWGVIAVIITKRGRERQHPFAPLQVIANEVVLCPVLPSPRDGERIPVERRLMDLGLVIAAGEPAEVDRHIQAI